MLLLFGRSTLRSPCVSGEGEELEEYPVDTTGSKPGGAELLVGGGREGELLLFSLVVIMLILLVRLVRQSVAVLFVVTLLLVVVVVLLLLLLLAWLTILDSFTFCFSSSRATILEVGFTDLLDLFCGGVDIIAFEIQWWSRGGGMLVLVGVVNVG